MKKKESEIYCLGMGSKIEFPNGVFRLSKLVCNAKALLALFDTEQGVLFTSPGLNQFGKSLGFYNVIIEFQ